MKANEFDKAVRHSYEQGSFDYNPAHWENMVQRLSEAENKKTSLAWLPFISYAASILFMVSIGAFLMRENAPQDKIAANSLWYEHSTIFMQQTITKPEAAWQNTAPALAEAVIPQTINSSAPQQEQAPVIQQQQVLAVALPDDAEKILHASLASAAQPMIQQALPKAPAYIDLSNPVYEPMEEKKNGKTIISIAGGLNYGSANSGYALGFTAYQKLADNLFFEGDVAFVNNLGGKRTEYAKEGSYTTTTTTITQTSTGGGAGSSAAAKPSAGSGAKPSGTAARPSGIAPTADEESLTTTTVTTTTQPRGSHYNLFYAQVTPTLGYNVFKNLSLSGGADVQRLLQGDQLMTITEHEADAKYVPSYDFGFVGKTEYAISKELKATVYYRHGLNNAISGGSGEKYIDRNYIQLQLKFSILNK